MKIHHHFRKIGVFSWVYAIAHQKFSRAVTTPPSFQIRNQNPLIFKLIDFSDFKWKLGRISKKIMDFTEKWNSFPNISIYKIKKNEDASRNLSAERKSF